MRTLAEETKILVGEQQRAAQLVENPVFRYDDQPRLFIDATMWVWTDGGRPVAFQKIEAKLHQSTGVPQWGYCFTSVSAENLIVEWDDRDWSSTKPGIEFRPLPEAPLPAVGSSQRRRQARELARGFSGRIVINPRTNDSTALQLLPTPIFEYSTSDDNLLTGAVFGFEVNGTNPDLLVLLEVRSESDGPQWHFAPARMTTGGISLNYRDQQVWTAPFVSPSEGPFANWLFFAAPRTVTGE
jgi:hypothetical protein